MIDLIAPPEFFRDEVKKASDHLGLIIDEHVEFYLVSLLGGITSTVIPNEPLAFILRDAIELPKPWGFKKFKELGDTSLLISGVWPKHINKMTVEIGYYKTMGATGYHSAARSSPNSHQEKLFMSLSESFDDCRAVLERASGAWCP